MKILNLSDKEIISKAAPIAENMQMGWNEDNYEKFSVDFAQRMKEVVTIDSFKKQRERIFPILGKYVKIELIGIHKNPEQLIVIWKSYYSNREEPALTIYHFDDNYKIEFSNLHY